MLHRFSFILLVSLVSALPLSAQLFGYLSNFKLTADSTAFAEIHLLYLHSAENDSIEHLGMKSVMLSPDMEHPRLEMQRGNFHIALGADFELQGNFYQRVHLVYHASNTAAKKARVVLSLPFAVDKRFLEKDKPKKSKKLRKPSELDFDTQDKATEDRVLFDNR